MTTPATPVSPYNIANVLTVARIVFVPVFLWALLHSGGEDPTWRWISLGIFVALMITDKIDGDLARKHNLITNFGKIADPIADKALMLAALVGLNIIGELWWWVTVVILVRELGITFWRMGQLRQGRVVPASKGGKTKTALQAVAVSLYLIPLGGFWDIVCAIVMGAAVIVTVTTGIQYLRDSAAANAAAPGDADTPPAA